MASLGVSVWRSLLGVDRATVIEEIDFDEEAETAVVHVRPRRCATSSDDEGATVRDM